ncbi:MAG: hypothetical protein KBC30_04325 [Planctomycetes bacterium]|nr:hypothetical protein [Planctomycetota bacterium]HPY75199.1 AarF/UbiB family protein [Planctomycetota bacterium]HQB00481.1 AarF/UbiB family protein [Planctomycetota bacterium]
MKLPNVSKTYRNVIRIKEILQVLTKHGFGHLVSRLQLSLHIPSLTPFCSDIPHYISDESFAMRVRMVFQELGPTFIKLGQILSTRPDILSEEFIQEFQLLQDQVPPFPSETIWKIIEEEFQAPVEEVFPFFDKNAIASGSIGQVHKAVIEGGQKVMVKIKRPGIEKIISTDIAILRFLAEMAEMYIEEAKIMQPVMIIDEFAKTIHKELDFTLEASYTERFYNLLKEEPGVSSPKIYWEYTTNNILVTEKVRGVKISNKEELQKLGIDCIDLADRFIYIFTKQYFLWGFFHADPHPGNILVNSDGTIYLIDFGMVGHLSEELKQQLATVILALYQNDIDILLEVYMEIGVFSHDVNRQELKNAIVELLEKYFHTPLQQLNLDKIFQDFLQLGRSYKITLPRDFVLLGKSFITAVAVSRDLNPDFICSDAITPHIASFLKAKFAPKRMMHMGVSYIWSLFTLLNKLPKDLKDLLRRLQAGNLKIVIKHEGFEKYLFDVHRMLNRLTFSILIAAIYFTSSILILAGVGPKVQDASFFGMIGLWIAIFMSIWLIIAILRSGHL